MLLAGVLLKMGTYGLVRVAVPVVPDGVRTLAPFLGTLGVVGILWGGLACLAERDLKRLVAFSSVAHMGFVRAGHRLADAGRAAGRAVRATSRTGSSRACCSSSSAALKDRYHSADLAAHRPGPAGPAAPARLAARLRRVRRRWACRGWPGSGVSCSPSPARGRRPSEHGAPGALGLRGARWRSSPRSAPLSPPPTCCVCCGSSGRVARPPRPAPPERPAPGDGGGRDRARAVRRWPARARHGGPRRPAVAAARRHRVPRCARCSPWRPRRSEARRDAADGRAGAGLVGRHTRRRAARGAARGPPGGRRRAGGSRAVRRVHDGIAVLGLVVAGAAVVGLAAGGADVVTACVPGGGLEVSACSFAVSPLTLTLQAVVIGAALVCLLLTLDGPGARDRAPHHVLLLAAVAGAIGARRSPGPRHPRRRARDGHAAGGRPGRAAPRPAGGPGRRDVAVHGARLARPAAAGIRADPGRDRVGALRPHLRGAGASPACRRGSGPSPCSASLLAVAGIAFKLSAGAVPPLDPGHVRRRTAADRGVPRARLQGRGRWPRWSSS